MSATTDLLQRARDIAAEAWLARARVDDVMHPDLRDDGHRIRYVGFMRNGAYDDEPLVQAAFSALRAGVDLAGSAAA